MMLCWLNKQLYMFVKCDYTDIKRARGAFGLRVSVRVLTLEPDVVCTTGGKLSIMMQNQKLILHRDKLFFVPVPLMLVEMWF